MRDFFLSLAGYNEWANRRLYSAASALSDEDYRRDRGAFFKSMHGTLNHLLVGDRVWMKRFTGEGEAPARLDTILHERLEDLRQAREAEDKRIIAFIESLDEKRLEGEITYRRISEPVTSTQRLTDALAHFFNHQTHHRGQAHAILTGLIGKAPELDLLYYHRPA